MVLATPMKPKQPEPIHLRIVETMKRFPEGASESQIRRELARQGVPAHALADLRRRLEELDDWFIIERLVGAESAAFKEECGQQAEALVKPLLRANVLYRARGRCGRCRKSVQAHGVTLLVRRKDPRRDGGEDPHDFWAICEECSCAVTHLGSRTRRGLRLRRCRTQAAR